VGVPQPQNDAATFANQFARMGFSVGEMVGLVACGHGIGGVGSGDFPTIVDPKGGKGAEEFVPFSRQAGTRFSEGVAAEYVAGNGSDPLVSGRCAQSRRCSDAVVFGADGNATIARLADPRVFRETCRVLFQRMIEVVPKGVVLTPEPLRPYEVKPVGLDLSVVDGGAALLFRGEIRVRTTARPAGSIAAVQLAYRPRGGGDCAACVIEADRLAGKAEGFDDTFSPRGCLPRRPSRRSWSGCAGQTAPRSCLTTTAEGTRSGTTSCCSRKGAASLRSRTDVLT
jgi:hypothetical protein